MKRAFIFHGWGGNPDGGFKPWLKRALEKNGYQVVVPVLPNTQQPKMAEWLSSMQTAIGVPNQETVLVGHSLGGLAILHYLQALPEGTHLRKVILVAPVVDAIMNMSKEEANIAQPWFDAALDAGKIRVHAKEMVGFFSDNDQFIPIESEQVLKNYGVKTVMMHNMGHFDDEAGIKKVPYVVEEICS